MRIPASVAASFVALVLALALGVPPREARACAIAGGAGREAPRIEGEEALIVWDEAHQREHFVRSARFAGVNAPFAFLVPTPGRPELGEADDRVFSRLSRIYLRPPPVSRSRDRSGSSRSIPAAQAPVTIVEEARVAGLDAVVLSATDPSALATWLTTHGFASRAGLDAWLAPYVDQGFHVTAFRYDPARQTAITSRAVRMSFPAERAFYPYAEPGDAARTDGRTLRVNVIAPFRVEAREGTRRWRARVGYAGRPPGLPALLGGVIPDPSSAGEWLTTFEDRPSRRGRDDLSFTRASAQREVAPSITARIL